MCINEYFQNYSFLLKDFKVNSLKILLLVAKFDPTGKNPHLADELCESLLNRGHAVDVLYLDWNDLFKGQLLIKQDNLNIHTIPHLGNGDNVFSKVIKWTGSSFCVTQYFKKNFSNKNYDALISFSPSIIFALTLLYLKKRIKNRLLVQWDFFPYSQAQIGLFPYKWMINFAAKIEKKLIQSYTYVGCMSPKNIEYLQNKYGALEKVSVGVLPIWSKIREKPVPNKKKLKESLGLEQQAFVCVFGGQITYGRGIDDIIELAKLSKKNQTNIVFLVIGSGPRLNWLIRQSIGLERYLIIKSNLPRSEYIDLISGCDVGLVITVPNTDVPTFPSKSLDYACVGIPIVASVEKTTDYGEIICELGIGEFCTAGDIENFFKIILDFSKNPAKCLQMGESARLHYENYFNVENATKILLEEMKN